MKDDNYFRMTPSLVAPFDKSARRTLTVDFALYEEYLAESGMSDAKKREYLENIWAIIWNFVELGIGVHPLQEVTAEKTGGQTDEITDYSTNPDSNDVRSKQEQTQPSEP